ncbi:hypothetical protein [Streptomyces violascens]|uniref:hypothetical protein n=1 Tax=Streptomyces violascens TaxID=67381 RepID=UPI0036B47CE0
MTEIVTGEGKPYLACVIDLFSRRLLGYAMGARHDAELVVVSLNMAAATCGAGQQPVAPLAQSLRQSPARGPCARRMPSRRQPQSPGRVREQTTHDRWNKVNGLLG